MRRLMFIATGALLAALLASCSQMPVPVEVDLRTRVPESSGSIEEPIEEGAAGNVDARLPAEEGQCVDFSDEQLPATVEYARLHYDVEVGYEGPDLSGKVQARLYAAGSAEEVWLERNRLGPTVTVDLDRSGTKLTGTAVLNDEQVEAINDREACWGVHLTGDEVAAASSGTATLSYRVDRLRLSVGVSVL